MTDQEKQVAQEWRQIEKAPRVELVHNSTGRCHFCGAVTRNLIFVERVGDGRESPVVERYRGEDCCDGQ